MTEEIAGIVRGLPELKSVTAVRELAERWMAAGEADRVTELGVALGQAYGGRAKGGWQYPSVQHQLLRMLARTPGAGYADRAARLVAADDGGELPRLAASLLASSRRPADLATLFRSGAGGSEELPACLVQELVVRGVDLAALPSAAEWVSAPYRARHPLAWLPLTRFRFELDPPLPRHVLGWSGHSLPGDASRASLPGSAVASVPAWTESTTAASGAAIGAAVRNWTEDSNGDVEARAFEFAEPLALAALPAALPAVGLDCTEGHGRAAVTESSPAAVWEALFNAASHGGAYSSSEYGAYGRLAAWRSLAGMVGAGEGASAAVVAELVEAHRWFGFSTGPGWFNRIAWDLGVLALSPDGRRLAVLAATDTD
ncbi:DUF6183 family protein [Kitasatospora sp. NPDC002227]|uniref:DUF6183 family protein n=1 Tax=Kitasatospora sp. NPDC002227 TaxID=3154773 RepID=UPI0033317346